MKGLIDGLNKAFDNKVRLGIMSVLLSRNQSDFNGLKSILDVTDGNLASHLKALEKSNYIQLLLPKKVLIQSLFINHIKSHQMDFIT